MKRRAKRARCASADGLAPRRSALRGWLCMVCVVSVIARAGVLLAQMGPGPASPAPGAITGSARYAALEAIDDPAVRAWVDEQRTATARWLDDAPARGWFRARFDALWNESIPRLPERQGRYFVTTQASAANQPREFILSLSADASTRLFSIGGATDAGVVRALRVSRDGRYVAYARAVAGASTQTWRIHDLASRHDLPDTIADARAGSALVWTGSARRPSLLYIRADVGARDERRAHDALARHTLGAPREAHVLFERGDSPRLDLVRSGDERTVLLMGGPEAAASERGYDRAWHLSAASLRAAPRTSTIAATPVISTPGARLTFVARDDDQFVFLTDHQAPRRRLIRLAAGASPSAWQTLLPQAPSLDSGAGATAVGGSAASEETLEEVVRVGEGYAARWWLADRRVLRLHDRHGRHAARPAAAALRERLSRRLRDAGLLLHDRRLAAGGRTIRRRDPA